MQEEPQKKCPNGQVVQDEKVYHLKENRFGERLLLVGTILMVLLIIIFLILPALFILLSNMWPTIFSGAAATKQLSNNVNSLVGIISLLVGIFSIYYSYTANKSMEVQSQSQQRFLEELRTENSQIILKLYQISQTNERLFDKIENLQGKQLSSPEKANEQ